MNSVRLALIVQHCLSGSFDQNLESTLGFIDQALFNEAEIIVFPEMNLTGYASGEKIQKIARPVTDSLIQTLSQVSIQNQCTILTGLAQQKEGKIFATHLVFTPNGFSGEYAKVHTAPFEKKYFTPGNTIPVFESHGLKFGIQLCYDAHFPELTLSMALKKTDIVFIPHASPRGTPDEKYESWIRHLRARAFDNGVFIAACNQVGHNGNDLSFPGVSLLIGPDGNVISKSLTHDPFIHYCTLDKADLEQVRSHKMRYFLPNRRSDLFPI